MKTIHLFTSVFKNGKLTQREMIHSSMLLRTVNACSCVGISNRCFMSESGLCLYTVSHWRGEWLSVIITSGWTTSLSTSRLACLPPKLANSHAFKDNSCLFKVSNAHPPNLSKFGLMLFIRKNLKQWHSHLTKLNFIRKYKQKVQTSLSTSKNRSDFTCTSNPFFLCDNQLPVAIGIHINQVMSPVPIFL